MPIAPRLGRLEEWNRDLALIRGSVDGHGIPLMVVGDLNATWGNRSFRRLLDLGLTDAAAARRVPFTMTWPRNRQGIPPLLRIDHVLTGNGAIVTKIVAGKGEGSDHRPLIADLTMQPRRRLSSPKEGALLHVSCSGWGADPEVADLAEATATVRNRERASASSRGCRGVEAGAYSLEAPPHRPVEDAYVCSAGLQRRRGSCHARSPGMASSTSEALGDSGRERLPLQWRWLSVRSQRVGPERAVIHEGPHDPILSHRGMGPLGFS